MEEFLNKLGLSDKNTVHSQLFKNKNINIIEVKTSNG